MIQQSINQLIGSFGAAVRLSPNYENRQIANESTKKASVAQAGLEDIQKNLQNPDKNYTETELADIKSRVAGHNKAVYDAKTLALSNKYAQVGVANLPSQATYGPMLKDIETNIAKREEALERVKARATTSITQDDEFKSIMDKIYNKMPKNNATSIRKLLEEYDRGGN